MIVNCHSFGRKRAFNHDKDAQHWEPFSRSHIATYQVFMRVANV